MVIDCLDKGRKISSLTNAQLKKYSDKLNPDIRNLLNAWASVTLKSSYGSTNPKLVAKQLGKWSKQLNA
jgi:argininosuccinate lyase